MPKSVKELSVLVVQVHYSSKDLLLDSLESLASEKLNHPYLSVLVVDNCSPNQMAGEIACQIKDRGWSDWITLIESEINGGYAYGNNLAVRYFEENNLQADVLWLLNPDTVVQKDSLSNALEQLSSDNHLIVGSRLIDPDGTPQKSKFPFPSLLTELSSGLRLGVLDRVINWWRRVTGDGPQWLAGASILMKFTTYREVGLMDDGFFLYFEEVDFINRAVSLGYNCVIAENSKVIHMVGASTGISDLRGPQPRRPKYWFESRNRYFLKNHGVLYLAACDLLFVVAYILWLSRKVVFDSRVVKDEPKNFLYDFISYGILNPRNWRKNF